MPIPVRYRPAPAVTAQNPWPVPVSWNRTAVTVAGRNGQGEVIPLTGVPNNAGWPTIFMQPGATGLDMPPYALFSDEAPNLDGSIFRSARAAAREVMIPVYLFGVDRQSVNQLKRQLFQALNPARGYCVLTFTEGHGRSRVLNCYYKGGMEGSEDTSTAGFTWSRYGLTFTAMDPWFYSERAQTKRWDFGDGEPFLSTTATFFPTKISSGVMGGDGKGLTINNPGDIEAWPVWSLRGPIKSFSLTSPYGETVQASPPADGSDLIPSGRTLTIDTRPGKKTVRDNLGNNYWSKLGTNPQFWSIEPGETSADISVVTGAGKAAVTLSFYPRYASFV